MYLSVTLPHEVLAIILGYLAPQNLCSTSLVSRSWRDLSFPHLYRAVRLTYASHLERLAKRICSEQNRDSPLFVSTFAQELSFDEEYKEWDDELRIRKHDLHYLAVLLPHLRRLECFSWDMDFKLRDTTVLHALQSECPNLKSVHFSIRGQYAASYKFYRGKSNMTSSNTKLG